MRLGWQIALLFVLDMLETFSRQDFALVLAGVHKTPTGRQLDKLLDRWRREELIARTGRGSKAVFRIADTASTRWQDPDPSAAWGRYWDGKWRIFSFDLPRSHRKERMKLWRHLRGARFGFLQRSVWIWPHDVEATLMGMVEAHGIPECFCGYEVSRLFLCNNTEVVGCAWDWERIRRSQEAYVDRALNMLRDLKNAQRVETLARLARKEYDRYRDAFGLDPLLPEGLLPDRYRGREIQDRHIEFRELLRDRIRRTVLG
jgi:phenylacetic acid degradation operon negative regulatory protein